MPIINKISITNSHYTTIQPASIKYCGILPTPTPQAFQQKSKQLLPYTQVEAPHKNKYLNAYTQVGLLLSPPKVSPSDMGSTSNNIR